MSIPVPTRALKKSSRLSLMKKDRQGVASTVGTIMALLVLLAFMALITNNYVPAWMMDNEREHMNQVIDQFGQLKGKVDSMIVEMELKGKGVTKMYAPLALGSAGVPLFATPTGGVLNYIPQGNNVSSIDFDYHEEGGSSIIPNPSGGGKVEFFAPNRYYVEQHIAYENGAIIISQSDGQTLRAFPSFEVNNVTGYLTVSYTQIDILGTNESVSGSDSTGFNIDLKYIDAQTYNLENGTLDIRLVTTYNLAWKEYFNNTMKASGLIAGQDYSPLVVNKQSGSTYEIILTIYNVGTVNYNRALVSMSMFA
jgi:hypothetical protein